MTSRPYPAVAAGGAAVQHKETMVDAPKGNHRRMIYERDALKAPAEVWLAYSAMTEGDPDFSLEDEYTEDPQLKENPPRYVRADLLTKTEADLAEARAQVAALVSLVKLAYLEGWSHGAISFAKHDVSEKALSLADADWTKNSHARIALSATDDAAKRHDAEVRRKALEEAANICADIAQRRRPETMPYEASMTYHTAAMDCADAIRALIDKGTGHE